jgi:hypothetical protein
MSELREAALQLCSILEALKIPYAIGGSFASSIHGIARATQDLDIIAALTLTQVKPLAEALKSSFYADPEQMRTALLQRRSFNVIHLLTAFKIDIFPASSHPLGPNQIERRQLSTSTILGGDPIALPVISAEDILLAKLRWYRDGGQTSERQWNDLRNILQIQGSRLDRDYLRHWAAALNVSELLAALLSEQAKPRSSE